MVPGYDFASPRCLMSSLWLSALFLFLTVNALHDSHAGVQVVRRRIPQQPPPGGHPELVPRVHPHLNRRDLDHLEPSNLTSIFFAENKDLQTEEKVVAATLIATTHTLAVPLDHTHFVKSVVCSNSSISIRFRHAGAIQHAQQRWAPHEEVTFISSSSSCNPGNPGQLGFFRANDLQFDQTTKAVRSLGSRLTFQDAVTDFDISWGTFERNTRGQMPLHPRAAHKRRQAESGPATTTRSTTTRVQQATTTTRPALTTTTRPSTVASTETSESMSTSSTDSTVISSSISLGLTSTAPVQTTLLQTSSQLTSGPSSSSSNPASSMSSAIVSSEATSSSTTTSKEESSSSTTAASGITSSATGEILSTSGVSTMSSTTAVLAVIDSSSTLSTTASTTLLAQVTSPAILTSSTTTAAPVCTLTNLLPNPSFEQLLSRVGPDDNPPIASLIGNWYAREGKPAEWEDSAASPARDGKKLLNFHFNQGIPQSSDAQTITTALAPLINKKEYMFALDYMILRGEPTADQCRMTVQLGIHTPIRLELQRNTSGQYTRVEGNFVFSNVDGIDKPVLTSLFIVCGATSAEGIDILLDNLSLVEVQQCRPTPIYTTCVPEPTTNILANPDIEMPIDGEFGDPNIWQLTGASRRQTDQQYKAQHGDYFIYANLLNGGLATIWKRFKGARPNKVHRLRYYLATGSNDAANSSCTVTTKFWTLGLTPPSDGTEQRIKTGPANQWQLMETYISREAGFDGAFLSLDVWCPGGAGGNTGIEVLLDNFSIIDLDECHPDPTTIYSMPPNTNTRPTVDPTATCGVRPTAFPKGADGTEDDTYKNAYVESPSILSQPFVPCGSTFDDDLDFEYGYLKYNETTAGSIYKFRTYMGFAGGEDWQSIRLIYSSRALGMGLVQAADNLVAAIKAIDDFVNKAIEAATMVIDIVTTFSPSIGFTIPMNMNPAAALSEKSPWGKDNSVSLYSYEMTENEDGFSAAKSKLRSTIETYALASEPNPRLKVWCVDCAVKGELGLTGSARISILKGPTSLALELHGKVEAGIFLGIEAYVEKEAEFLKQRLFTTGIPGLSIPGLITIGPMITLDVDGKAGVQALGTLLTGAKIEFPDMRATLDVIDTGRTGLSGFKPIITTKFEAAAELTLSTSIGLPLGIGIGIDVLNGKWEEGIALVTRPYIGAQAHWNTPSADDEDGCDGIDWSIGTGVECEFDLFDKSFQLGEWEGPKIASGCLGKGIKEAPEGDPVSPTDPDSTASPTATASPIYSIPPIASLLAATPQQTSTPTNLTDGQTRVVDVSDKFVLVAGDDGNVYLGDPSNPNSIFDWAGATDKPGGIVYGANNKYLAWHPDTMAAYGVSRLRLVDQNSAVKGQSFASLTPARGNIFVAMGTAFAPNRADVVYALAWCNSPSYQGSRVFIVRNYAKALATLASKEVQWIVTGAEISQCAPLILKHNTPPLI